MPLSMPGIWGVVAGPGNLICGSSKLLKVKGGHAGSGCQRGSFM